MQIIWNVVVVILLVDFASGLLHWIEDSYGRPDWPLTGKLITAPNILHHHNPTFFTRHSWLRSADVLIPIAIGILAASWHLGILTWQMLLFVAIGVNANEIHKWNHLPARKRPRFIAALHSLRLLQTPQHHIKHHVAGKDTHYCVITNVVNPVVDAVRFWRILEKAIAVLFGAHKRLA